MAILKPKYGYQLITYDAHLPSGFKAVGNVTAKRFFYFLFRLFFAKLLNERGNLHVAVQEQTATIMHDLYGIKRVVHIPLGTDTTRFYPSIKLRQATRKILKLSPHFFTILYTGKIVPTKGVHLLFGAFNLLCHAHKDIALVLVGEGSPEYRRICFNNLNRKFHSRVKWVGYKPNADLVNYYNSADIGVWPLEESTSMNDAAACGLPFIANDTVGARVRLSNHNALLYKCGDIQDLASLIDSLYKNRTLAQKMGARGRDLMVKRLSWHQIAKEYLTELKKATNAKTN